MNKAFVREPESDGRAYCPRCGALGLPVGAGPLDKYIRSAVTRKNARRRLVLQLSALRSRLLQ